MGAYAVVGPVLRLDLEQLYIAFAGWSIREVESCAISRFARRPRGNEIGPGARNPGPSGHAVLCLPTESGAGAGRLGAGRCVSEGARPAGAVDRVWTDRGVRPWAAWGESAVPGSGS